MEQQCCSGGQLRANPPATCRAGFNTISGDSAGGAAFNISIAETTLNVASNLNGASTDFNQVAAPQSGSASSVNPPKAVITGMHSAGDAGAGGDGPGFGGSRADDGSGSGGYGYGTGASGGGSGGGVGLLSDSTIGGAGPAEGKNKDPNTDTNAPLGGKFASNGQGKDDFGSRNMDFGSGGGVGNGEGTDGSGNGLEELGFGDEDLTGGANGDVEGTVVDPSNYFSLTHKSDDLFKIVTRRYHKKWKKLAVTQPKGRVPAGKSLPNKPL
jgi:hypothetical protein